MLVSISDVILTSQFRVCVICRKTRRLKIIPGSETNSIVKPQGQSSAYSVPKSTLSSSREQGKVLVTILTSLGEAMRPVWSGRRLNAQLSGALMKANMSLESLGLSWGWTSRQFVEWV